MARHRRAKVNIPICLAMILLCLTLFSIRLAGGVAARYTTTTGSGDSARVISFGDIDLTLYGDVPQYIAPGVALEWNAKVTFKGSESATYVFLEVTPVGSSCVVSDGGMTYTFPPAVTDGWEVDTGWTFLKNDSGTYVYYLALAPSKSLDQVFFRNSDITVSDNVTADKLDEMDEITASFRASVVQSNGFDSVDEAWKSLESKHG